METETTPATRQDIANHRKANQRSWAGRMRVLAIFGFLLLLAGTGVAGWFWITREVEPVVLTVGAGPYRSDSHQLMREVAEVVERHSDTIRLDVRATSDSSRNISLLNAGALDLVTIRSDTPVLSDVRIVADLFADYFQIIARNDRSIRSVNALVGKRVAVPPFGTDEFRSFWAIGDHYNLPIEGVRWISLPFDRAAGDLLDGRIDAIFTVRSLRDRRLLDLFEDASLKRLPLNFVEIAQGQAIAIKRPFLGVGEIPEGSFAGENPTPSRDIATSTVRRLLVTREDVDAGAIRELTRILFEHRLDLTIRFALASQVRVPDASEGLNSPLHAGAQSYYDRDQPSFIQENAEPLALGVTLTAMLLSGLFALRSNLVRRQKNRMDSYNYLLLDIADKARTASSVVEITALKNEMFSLLETVVRALDTDEVTDEGFQSFSLLFESVREMLEDSRRQFSER